MNPAVTLGMVLAGRMQKRLLPWYMASQLLGGIAVGALLLLLLNAPIAQYEAAHAIVRGAPESVRTAMMFGEYFPNPGMAQPWLSIGIGTAALTEMIGTFVLVMMIFLLTEGCNVGRPAEGVSPVFIGGTVTAVISILAPLTQAGLNPARDFGPRIVAYFAGWGSVAIPGPQGSFLWCTLLRRSWPVQPRQRASGFSLCRSWIHGHGNWNVPATRSPSCLPTEALLYRNHWKAVRDSVRRQVPRIVESIALSQDPASRQDRYQSEMVGSEERLT